MAKYEPDAIIVVAFGHKIPKAMLELPSHGCINVHASLLPKYRGAAPIHHAIMNGERVTGVTTMYLSEGWDEGDLILQAEEPILPTDTAGTLHDRLALKGAALLAGDAGFAKCRRGASSSAGSSTSHLCPEAVQGRR